MSISVFRKINRRNKTVVRNHRFLASAIFLMIWLCSSPSFAWWMWTPGDSVDDSTQNSLVAGYKPDQPIPFSHKLHAGKRQIACQYCHNGARRSASAVIPSTALCMGCHQVVAVESEPIKWLTQKYKNKEPVEWVRVHDMPHFVRFTHKMHVISGVSCETCHGPVAEMEKVGQWAPMQMGWCISCHKENNASISCQTCHY